VTKGGAIVGVAFALVLLVYALDHGVFVGSSSSVSQGFRYKDCSYLFPTGISALPAHLGTGKGGSGYQLADEPDNLYCRLFAE
jgi:hypothetical protein